MVRGYDKHQQHLQALETLGRPLARRARSRCELCTEGGVKLRPWEVPPAPSEPDLDTTLLLCDRCRAGCEGGELDERSWRFLEDAMWSELPATKVTAIRQLKRLEEGGCHWARAAMETAYLEPEIEAWLER